MLSPDIIQARMGCITASEAHSIMAGWDVPRPADCNADIYEWIERYERKPLVGDVKDSIGKVSGADISAAWAMYQWDKPPQGLLTYAEKLACQELFEPDPMEWDGSGNKHIDNGNEREVDAMIALSEATGLDFVKTGDDQIHVSVDGVGCTPDGVVYDDLDLISDGAEVKCRSPLHHARQLLIHDNASLLEHDFDRYCQIQVGYQATGAGRWFSASYNPHAINPLDRFHYCEIKRDDAFLEVFNRRARMVFEHKALFLEQLKQARTKRGPILKVAA